ncbi:MAG: hypothetical protein HYX56_03425 [Chloroflexi bacterium]|nr:hypothetical protein [Chloroflexota bacterium]
MAKGAVAAKRSQLERSLVGPAAEHFVLYKLHGRGFLATLAPENAPTVDILVMNPDETITALIQVKARTRGADKGWHMQQKHEGFIGKTLFYAFVDLEEDPPITYIVPAAVVADVINKTHAVWLSRPGLKGQPHRDHPMRRVLPSYEGVEGYPPGWLMKYRERWEDLRGKPRT